MKNQLVKQAMNDFFWVGKILRKLIEWEYSGVSKQIKKFVPFSWSVAALSYSVICCGRINQQAGRIMYRAAITAKNEIKHHSHLPPYNPLCKQKVK